MGGNPFCHLKKINFKRLVSSQLPDFLTFFLNNKLKVYLSSFRFVSDILRRVLCEADYDDDIKQIFKNFGRRISKSPVIVN
jgi:hypothetical protein